jgi:hypothetical protein
LTKFGELVIIKDRVKALLMLGSVVLLRKLSEEIFFFDSSVKPLLMIGDNTHQPIIVTTLAS